MANTQNTKTQGRALTKNTAGGTAYKRNPESALAQIVMTGTIGGNTYYASADTTEAIAHDLAHMVSPQFLARVAIYGRQHGFMKDFPAFALAVLHARGERELFKAAFPRVIDNSKMLRNLVTFIREGKVLGRDGQPRKSLPYGITKDIKRWFQSREDYQLFFDSIGNKGMSLADIIRLVHPKGITPSREALYAYILGRDTHKDGRPRNDDVLPEIVQQYEAWKANTDLPMPKVPFQMLTHLELNKKQWTEIAERATWQQTRMLLNTFQRHGVLEDKTKVKMIADRLRNPELIGKSKVFPYQLFMAYKMASAVPQEIQSALQDAIDIACQNVPVIDGQIFIGLDVSGSMGSPVTGRRGPGTSQMRCVDVACLFAAAYLKANPNTEVIPFADRLYNVRLNPRDSIVTMAQSMNLPGGGTNMSLVTDQLNKRGAEGDLLIFLSDNQSWMDYMPRNHPWWGYGTGVQAGWEVFKKRNPQSKLVLNDLQPYTTSQADESHEDILLVGGFSDQVFKVVDDFVRHGDRDWVDTINQAVEL